MVDERRGPAQRRRHLVVLAALVAGIVLCWILLTPPGAGADEPGHLVRAGALAHGQLDGSDIGSQRYEGFDVPGTYRVPEPACYAHHPAVPVSCAPAAARSDETVTLPSSADEYPIWGHLPGGLFSRLPGLAPIWWARVGGAAVATALVAGALWLVTPPAAARRRRPTRRPHADGVVGVRQRQSIGDGDRRRGRPVGRPVVRRSPSDGISRLAHRLRLGGGRASPP